MQVCMKNSWWSTNIWSITAECSRLIAHCPKNHLASLFRDPYRYCRQKNGNTHVWNRAVPSCKFSRRSVRDICPWAKVHIFPYRGLPGATIACYTFFRSSYQAIVTPYYSTCNAVTYHVRGQNFGFLCPLGYPRGRKHIWDTCTIMQKFTLIGGTSAKISVPRQIDTYKELQQT